jgi:hypothetical protein
VNTSFEAANAAADRVAIKIVNEAAHAVAGRAAAISDEADKADKAVTIEANKVVVVIFGVNKAVVVIVKVNEAIVVIVEVD